MKILIAAGGTGGHFYPAIAVGDVFRRNGHEVVFVASERGLEASKYKLNNFRYEKVCARQFYTDLKSIVLFIISLFKGFYQAIRIVRREKPDIVLGMGGYVSVPVLLSCVALRKTFFLHEQNIIPGRTNLIFSRFASAVFTGFPDSSGFFKGKAIYSGNPLRTDLQRISKLKARSMLGIGTNGKVLLVYGGSGGAKKLNETMPGLIDNILSETELNVIIITGKANYSSFIERVDIGKRIKVFEYVDDMSIVYSASDLAISRAGAMTLSELAFYSIPSIVVPFPYARDNHQLMNARFFERYGNIVVIEEKDLSMDLLRETILKMLKLIDEGKLPKHIEGEELPSIKSADLIYKKMMEIAHEKSVHGRN